MRARSIFGAAALAASVAGSAAWAQTPDPVAALYANTIVEHRANGTTSKFLFNPDGMVITVNGAERRSSPYYYRASDGGLCMGMRPAPGAPDTGRCPKMPTRIGDSADWVPREGGEHNTFTLVAGRE